MVDHPDRNEKGRLLKGWKPSKEWRKKLSDRSKRNKYNLGRQTSQQTKQKISESQKGDKGFWYGKKMSEETKQKMSKASLGKKKSNGHAKNISKAKLGTIHTEETKEKIKLKRLKQVFPVKDTKPERMMQLALTLHGIEFEKHYPIKGQPDIYIYNKRICIFVDGDYWHNRPDQILRDARVNHELNKKRYHVIRVWEHDILEDVNECAENIIALINSCDCSILHGNYCNLMKVTN